MYSIELLPLLVVCPRRKGQLSRLFNGHIPNFSQVGKTLTKPTFKQTEGKQGYGPSNPNEIDGHSDGVYYVICGRFEDALDGYGEGQILIPTQEATSADQYPQANGRVLDGQMSGQEPDEDNAL